ncbi:MAG TPA: primosomal protein N', partial [Thermodesulfovibrionales bacterium]|nr:primosomal protein N' [Thermodesulfovibrionales bacterium]
MNFFDVVFPLNIGPLTYKRPSGYDRPVMPGVAVRAEVKKTLRYGIVLREAQGVPHGPVKEIAEVLHARPLYSKALLDLISWMAEYYLTPEGVVLKSIIPKEVFEKAGRYTASASVIKGRRVINHAPAESGDTGILCRVRESVSQGQYRTYLLHAPTVRYEISSLMEIIEGMHNVIILAPEISILEKVSAVLPEIVGDRLAVLHGQLSKVRRRNAVHNIMSGEADIVLGTRPAVFAPLKSVSLVIVLQEHNRSYKNLEGLRYQARDVAVMRGYLEKAVVVLSSATPSMESFYNTLKSKYVLLRPDMEVRRPKIEVINMKTARKETPYLSKRSLQAADSCIRNGKSVLFFINRKGYSLIQCSECNDIPSCPKCRVPLIYHKDRVVLKCHCCNYTSRAPQNCEKCKSPKLEMVGAGTQRIASDLKKHLAIEPLRFDEDALRENPGLRGFSGDAQGENIIVGTKAFTGRLRSKEAYDLCVFLNPDVGLHLPDFRSAEILFQEIFGMSELIDPEGAIIVQTRMPENSVYKNIKTYSFDGFFEGELSARKALMYPPFSRMTKMLISSEKDISKMLLKALAFHDDEVEVIGPLALSGKGRYEWKIVLKSGEREK